MDGKQKPIWSKALWEKFVCFVNPKLKKLLGWDTGDSELKWTKKAVEMLAIRLKKQKGALENLEQALRFPNLPSKCVTVPRTYDGRMTILHRRNYTHVIYCRIWRWPDLEKRSELRSLDICENPYSERQTNICINPYHYARVNESTDLPPVNVPQCIQSSPKLPVLSGQEVAEFLMTNNVSCPPDIVHFDYDNNTTHVHPGQSSMPYIDDVQNPENMTTSNTEFYYGENTLPTLPWTSSALESDYQSQSSSSSSTIYHPNNSAAVTPIYYEEPEYWASIAYYELNFRVGDVFTCQSNIINVDGFTNPSGTSNRFCLGQLSNINRTTVIESVRRHIGKGVKLSYVGSEVYIQCLSKYPVFIQSQLYNHEHGFHTSTVCKILPGFSLKIFSNEAFSKLLSQYINYGFGAVYELTKMCTIRMSFVKGWGGVYHRVDATSTPCWIEIHLNGPLRWLDNVLLQMGPPLNAISSVS